LKCEEKGKHFFDYLFGDNLRYSCQYNHSN
jgi:hypothetical protein